MTKDNFLSSRVHHGINVRQFRRSMNLSRENLAQEVGITLPILKLYETMKIIDNSMLEKFAKVFQIPPEVLKYMERDTPSIHIENNTFTKNQSVSNIGNHNVDDCSSNIFNPIDTIINLYERLLKATLLNTEDLNQRVSDLERKFQ